MEAKKKPSLKSKVILLQICSFLVSIAPLVICVAIHWDEYTATPADSVKLAFGGILALVFIGLKAIGKLKMPKRIILFAFVALFSFLLEKLLQDLLLLSVMAFAGEVIDHFVFQHFIKKLQERILIEKTATATTEQVEGVMKNLLGRA